MVAGERVERAEGLVHQQDFRAVAQRPGDGDALLHAAGKLGRIGVLEPLQADQRQMLAGDGARLAPSQPGGPKGELDIADRGEPRQQRVALEDDAAVEARPSDRNAVDADRPLVVLLQPRGYGEKRRLAAARGADEGDELVLADIEVEAAERDRLAALAMESLAQAPGNELRRGQRRTSR
jgi:hypothetical protein